MKCKRKNSKPYPGILSYSREKSYFIDPPAGGKYV